MASRSNKQQLLECLTALPLAFEAGIKVRRNSDMWRARADGMAQAAWDDKYGLGRDDEWYYGTTSKERGSTEFYYAVGYRMYWERAQLDALLKGNQ